MRRLVSLFAFLLVAAGASCTDNGTTFTFDAGGTDTRTSSDASQTDAGADSAADASSNVGAVSAGDGSADGAT